MGVAFPKMFLISLASLKLITWVPATAAFLPWCFGYWQVLGACQYFPRVKRWAGQTVISLTCSSVSSRRPALARIRSFSQIFSLDRWWFWRCQLISPSQLFRAIHSVNPRLLPHVPLVIAEKEHDTAIANSKNDAKRKKWICYHLFLRKLSRTLSASDFNFSTKTTQK